MIRIVAVIVAALALIVIVHDRETDGPAQASHDRIETGWTQLDSFLADNLSADTHTAISTTVSGPAEVIRGMGEDVKSEVGRMAPKR